MAGCVGVYWLTIPNSSFRRASRSIVCNQQRVQYDRTRSCR